jgi:hypothetical protein
LENKVHYIFQNQQNYGLINFEIFAGHSNDRDAIRSVSYSIGEPVAYKILDEGCAKILLNYASLIKTANFKNLIRFNVLVKVENEYFNFVICFNSKSSAILFTSIVITKNKY